MMVGYATDHPCDTYCIWNPVSNGVHVTQDVIWHKKMYFEMEPVAEAEEESDSDSDDDAEEDNPNASNYYGVLEAGRMRIVTPRMKKRTVMKRMMKMGRKNLSSLEGCQDHQRD